MSILKIPIIFLSRSLLTRSKDFVIIIISRFLLTINQDFRPSFSHLAEVRSLTPAGTPCMASTATATRSVHEVIKSYKMTDCVYISVAPDRSNIYEVRKRTDIDTDFADMIDTLRKKLVNTHASP